MRNLDSWPNRRKLALRQIIDWLLVIFVDFPWFFLNLRQSIFLIVSKSGNTSETIINSSYFKSFFKKSNTIIISENKNNILSNFAKSKGYNFVKHNPFIGGRYSVFSEVGMLPAYLMGLNTKNFKKNLPKFINNTKLLLRVKDKTLSKDYYNTPN